MVLKQFLLLSVLCVGCLAYLAPGSRIRTHSSIMNPPSRMLVQGIRMQPSGDAISVRVESHKPSTNQIIAKSLTRVRKFFSEHCRGSPRWITDVSKKGRIVLLSVFMSALISLGRGRSVEAVAAAESTVQNVVTGKGKPGAIRTSELIKMKKSAAKKTVFAEFIVASNSVAHRADATHSHGKTSDTTQKQKSANPSVSEKSSPIDASSSVPSDTKKKPKELKRGMAELLEAEQTIKQSLDGLVDSMRGAKLDTLIMLMVTSAVIPVLKHFNLSPILGFLFMGTILGPSCLKCIHDVHTIDALGELGIVFFLFEMGLELSITRLNALKKDVFGLGTCQFLLTAALGSGASMACGLPTAAAVTIGGSLALSSSAFVLQLLKDKNQMGTRHGKASFGILLLQDLAVVPLLVVVELLAKGGTGLGHALCIAAVKALVTLSVMGFTGRKLLNPIFYYVAKSRSHEAFLSIILTTVLLMSFVTQGIGLSNTLGAFLAGLLLAETKYKYQIEADIAPFRGLLLGFFFTTVGFNIDLAMIFKEAPRIAAMLGSLIVGKAAVIALLSLAFGMSFANAQRSGLLLAQGGEFAFVALGIAERSGLIAPQLCKMLLTTVALSMAATPMLAEAGTYISMKIEKEKGLTHYLGQDSDAEEMKSESKDFVLVAGYGRVGKMVCDMLDRLPVRYIALDSSPTKAIEARGKGLPVFYGDINRPEVLRNFDVGAARACVFAIDDMAAINKAVINVRKVYPDLPLLVKAKNTEHKQRLEKMFSNIYVMSPVFHQESVLLTLPFGGAVLRALGMSQPETEAILEDFRKIHMEDVIPIADDTFNFLDGYASNSKAAVISYPVEKREKDKEEKDKDKEKDKHNKEGSWEDTDEQERQEEEEEMHEFSRNVFRDKMKKLNMNGMIGGDESDVEATDAPVSVYLDGVGDMGHDSATPSVASVGAQEGGSTQ